MSINAVSNVNYMSYIDLQSYDNAKNAAVLFIPGYSGISGWVFDIPRGETITLTADITEHYTEDGSNLTDHVVLKPTKITLTGYVGNLVYKAPQKGSLEYLATQATSALGTVSAYAGPLTQGATQIAAQVIAQASYAANVAKNLAKKATNVVNFFKNGSTGNKEPDAQTIAYHEIRALWKSKQIVSVQTYWEFFPSMCIESITASHDEMTDDITDFSVTLKELRIVEIETTKTNEDLFKAANETQSESVSDKGRLGGEESDPDSVAWNIRDNSGLKK